MKLDTKLRALAAEVIGEAKRNPEFAARLEAALGNSPVESVQSPGRRRNRRDPAPFDPFEAFQAGEKPLRARLEALDVEQLKDMVAEHGMDSAKLALKWKSADRLIELIVATVATRSRKGDAFRGDGSVG